MVGWREGGFSYEIYARVDNFKNTFLLQNNYFNVLKGETNWRGKLITYVGQLAGVKYVCIFCDWHLKTYKCC